VFWRRRFRACVRSVSVGGGCLGGQVLGRARSKPVSSNVSRIAQVLRAVISSGVRSTLPGGGVVGSAKVVEGGRRNESWFGSIFPPGKTIAEEKDIDFEWERCTRRTRFWWSRRRREEERRGVAGAFLGGGISAVLWAMGEVENERKMGGMEELGVKYWVVAEVRRGRRRGRMAFRGGHGCVCIYICISAPGGRYIYCIYIQYVPYMWRRNGCRIPSLGTIILAPQNKTPPPEYHQRIGPYQR